MGLMKMAILFLAMAAFGLTEAVDISQLRLLAAKNNMTCVLVFGDSSVDPGNNNRLDTTNKGNFPPYGKDFINGRPSGRFTNGRLTTDFIAEALGYKKIIRGFLDPHLNKIDMLHGISFASAASGYDDLTANLSSVISLSKQMEYLKHYMIHLRRLVGATKAEELINNAVFVLSMGTNDFLQNYFLEPVRSKQFSVAQYEDFLITSMSSAIKEMHSIGARRVVVVGVPPLGCLPLVLTFRGETKCDEALNKLALSFSTKLRQELTSLKGSLGLKTSFVDIYTIIGTVIQNPKSYGFTEALKGCCGTGTFEYGSTCRGLATCSDRTKYVFWDAVHFTESLYGILADEALKTISVDLLN
ncbi:GDSL esterase/lipase At5g45950 [Coffea eugenioides]|uniref:GDSL esterase/lipase At5g45950 n=1 Tax=Coffea arabica TaxID=13443 RepID=A0A6P6VU67_COFAR|nr:GDSL esterase/lipase At5g45950-like [Coffea arabica]XP_027161906.1 GDSL esterase/lipase At5g45950 [Coffea eugenioides]